MNNYISNNLKKFSKWSEKIKQFIFENKKIIFLILLFSFLVVFILSFSLYLFSGIGLHPADLEDQVNCKWNGVWSVNKYINTELEIIEGRTISRWQELKGLCANNPGFKVAANFFNQAYYFYKMNTILLPIWATFFSLLLLVLILYLVFKYKLKPWVIKNLNELENQKNVENDATNNSFDKK